MSKFFGTVTITRTWTNVEVKAGSEDEAETVLDTLPEADLGVVDSEDREVTDIEADEDEEEEESDED